jgi:DNA polymerase sigma
MECDFTRIENNFRDYILRALGPNLDHDYSREIKFKAIKKIIQNGFAAEPGIIAHVFSFGSFPLRTYLPDSDMDITVILEDRSTNQIISNLSYEYLNK